MQLALDLTDKQTNKLVNIFKSNPKPRSKNKSDIHASETKLSETTQSTEPAIINSKRNQKYID